MGALSVHGEKASSSVSHHSAPRCCAVPDLHSGEGGNDSGFISNFILLCTGKNTHTHTHTESSSRRETEEEVGTELLRNVAHIDKGTKPVGTWM